MELLPGFAGGFLLLKGSFSFPTLPSASSQWMIWCNTVQSFYHIEKLEENAVISWCINNYELI